MDKQKRITQLVGAAVAFLAAFSAVGCLVTAMAMPQVQMGAVALACGISAVVFSLCCRRRLGWVPMCFLALLGGYLWQLGGLERSVEGLVYHITSLYDSGYGWGAVSWTNANPSLAPLTPALCAVGIAASAAMAWTVAGRHMAWLGMPVSWLPLAACMVLTDTVPREGYLYWFLFSQILVILTQFLRRLDEKKGNALTAMAAIPVAVALGLLMLLCPQKTYTGHHGAERLEEWVMDLLGIEEDPGGNNSNAVGLNTKNKVNLWTVGPKTYQSSKVITVVDQRGGLLYLRGCAYDVYDGTSWERSETIWQSDNRYVAQGESWQVSISTKSAQDVVFMPYLTPALLGDFFRGRVENLQGQTEFTFECYAMPEYQLQWEFSELDFSSGIISTGVSYLPEDSFVTSVVAVPEQYLQLPEDTAQRARQWLEAALGPIPPAKDRLGRWQYVCDVVELVRESASYNLRTQRMPADETDFALWFLEDSDTGYCVHFATAATVLLRSAGIPARYVTGYLANTSAGEPFTVRMRDAHAWVEVYDSVSGWLTLDPTPAGFGSPVPVPQQTQPPQTTEPTTQPTETTEPTLPEPTTEPTVHTRPTLPEPTTEPTASTSPVGGADGPELPKPDRPSLNVGKWLIWLLPVLAAVLAVIGQWQLRLWLCRKKQRAGAANAQALARWREVSRHAKLHREQPEALRALAQKAKFSQHTLTEQELAQFDEYLHRSQQRLRRAPLLKRLYYRFVLALY